MAAARFGGPPARRRALPAAVAALLLWLLGAPGPAGAEEVFTSQAAAANATASTWIPAPSNPAAVCIVDTGVDPNPDTTNVIARLAVDGGDPGDVDTIGHHGTLMAMIASAPYNGWGMVGAAPSVKVVSVRAKRPGESGFYFSDVLKAVQLCSKARLAFNIKVISLSLGGRGTLDVATETLLEDAIDSARSAAMNVVAAAGNHPGPADWPASYAPVLAVAASDKTGSRCTFSASGPQVDLFAPGCPQDVALPDGRAAWASGTSESTAFVAAALGQLRGLRPELGVEQVEDWFRTAAAPGAEGLVVDVDAALRAAGVGVPSADGSGPSLTPSSVQQAPTVSPSAPGSSQIDAAPAVRINGVTAPSSGNQNGSEDPRNRAAPLPRPVVRKRHLRHGMLQLTFVNRPAKAWTRIQSYSRHGRGAFPTADPPRLIKSDRTRTHVSGTMSQMSIMYVDPSAKRSASPVLVIRP
ncbi:MAG TPA: S8 family serine peptidase [Baekduia sp.]|jgi:hypothetical protein|nr:S8 family serine peptidase [Baekduia sp.]